MAVNEKNTTSQQGSADATTGTQDQTQNLQSGRTINVPSLPQLPSLGQMMEPKRLLWFGGLAAAGVVGVLEWPVVAAVGVGSYVAEQFAKSDVQKGRSGTH